MILFETVIYYWGLGIREQGFGMKDLLIFIKRGTFAASRLGPVWTSSNGGGVCVTHTLYRSGNYSGTFTMKDGTISGNTATDSGGGVYVNSDYDWGYGTFIMEGGIISGNTATYYGGGVYVTGTYIKTGGTIHGDDADQKLKNTVITKLGHAVYDANKKNWRNATAGLTMNTDSYGFWLNDGDVVMFPSGFAGRWRRSNFNNTLTLTENAVKSSSRDFVWILQKISGNAYTLKRADAANTMTLTIRLDGNNLVISGDSGNGENNWNGTWRRQ